MKKPLKLSAIILCLIVTVLALVACNEECTSHVDENGDLKCDNCGADISTNDDGDDEDDVTCSHVDTNLDERCDLCGAEQLLNDGKVTYSVYISNGIGGGYSDFIVEFCRNGDAEGEVKRTDRNGYAYIRLNQGKYNVTLIDTQERGLIYNDDGLELTATNRNLVIDAALSITAQQTRTIMGNIEDFSTTEAYAILGEGAYNVSVNPNKIVPVVWVPKQTGVYTFTFQSEVGVKLTYNGVPDYVQSLDCLDADDRISDESFEITIYSYNLANPEQNRDETTPYVLGIKANAVQGSGILKVERTAEAPPTHYDVPWTVSNSALPGQITFGSELTKDDFTYVNLDGTDSAVYNQDDGLYHLNSVDGAVLYIQLKYVPTVLLGSEGSSGYEVAFEELISNVHFGVERLDGENVISKIDYSDHLRACLEKVNETDENDNRINNAGVYYLTESMIAGIKDYGDYNGWWDEGYNIFGDNLQNINKDYAWMFAVCYLAD